MGIIFVLLQERFEASATDAALTTAIFVSIRGFGGRLNTGCVNFYARQHICYSASLRQRRVCPSVRPSVCHTPVLCLAERKQDREMYTI